MTYDMWLMLLAMLFMAVGFCLNIFNSSETVKSFVWNVVGDVLMVGGLYLAIAIGAPPRAYVGFQNWFRGDLFLIWFGLFVAMVMGGFVLNLRGHIVLTPATPPADTSAWKNWVGDGLLLVGAALLFMLFFNAKTSESFRNAIGAPAVPSLGATPLDPTEPQNVKYDSATGDVVTDNDSGDRNFIVYWKGGSTPPTDPTGGRIFGTATKKGNIGTGATEVKVRFATIDGKKFSNAIDAK